MKLKELLNEDKVYTTVENEIREWVENTYPGLSIEFYPRLEIVRLYKDVDFKPDRVRKITEVVNIKIGDIMEKHAEEIYIAERLTRIWKKHPRVNPDIENIADVKKNQQFLKYLQELITKRKEIKNGK